LVFQVQVLTNH